MSTTDEWPNQNFIKKDACSHLGQTIFFSEEATTYYYIRPTTVTGKETGLRKMVFPIENIILISSYLIYLCVPRN